MLGKIKNIFKSKKQRAAEEEAARRAKEWDEEHYCPHKKLTFERLDVQFQKEKKLRGEEG